MRGGGGGLDQALTGTLVMQVVESVIQLRRAGSWGHAREDGDAREDGRARDEGHAHEIAASCLRVVGLGPQEIARARGGAAELIAAL